MSLSLIVRVEVTGTQAVVVGTHSPSPGEEGAEIYYFYVLSRDGQVVLRGDVRSVLDPVKPEWRGAPHPRPAELADGETVQATALGVIQVADRAGFQTLVWAQDIPVVPV
ncbi:hypothetical protein MF672_021355 [Actinomadura sp. ATCC 31491]|uniref:Uncharacterized protein n=1 Tax=Actinomadura luzonensis TaxID=2805427 RepID=A0ABT0FWS0_9ACTN|nr:hypothetical protein [Actinomadura luzonensis]MCK2216328.1 hypothetical protein [Actinomadura luzonensis]